MAQHLQALYDEHQSVAAVLHALHYLGQQLVQGKPVDAKVFRQIIYYLDVFPERFHHAKEDELLFPAIRARTREADAVLDLLAEQHARGERAIRALEQSLLRWEAGGAAEREAFTDAVAQYVERYREHMRLEEEALMPLAVRHLSPEDWVQLDAAFAQHRDPLHGANPGVDPDELFRRVLYIAPPPIGLGPVD